MDIGFANNQTWVWSLNLSEWALLYDLSLASFEMQIRDGGLNDVIQYRWRTGETVHGRIDYEPASKLLISRAPYADMKAIPGKTYNYDLQMSFPAGNPIIVKLFARGDVTINQGVTR